MKLILTLFLTLSSFSVLAGTTDERDFAISESAMVQAIRLGLQDEQELTCEFMFDNTGKLEVTYFNEDDKSKFSVPLLCEDGRMAVIQGVIGDGGQTAVEKFELVWGS